MDYKKIFKDQHFRFWILNTMSFLPDIFMVSLQYRLKYGRKLNLTNPRRFSEKLNWYKLYYHDPLMSKCSDKYTVREYVKEKGFECALVPLLGVYSKVSEIDFDKLPNSFVIKLSNGSHTNIFCNDKSSFDIDMAKNKLSSWLKQCEKGSKQPIAREWAYKNTKARILVEQMLPKDENNDTPDYKFFCFYGHPVYFVVNTNRTSGNVEGGIFNMNKSKAIDYYRTDMKPLSQIFSFSKDFVNNFEKMKHMAEILSAPFPCVRVDLYNLNGKIYFGEMTYYDSGGYLPFATDKFDIEMGDNFTLPKKKLLLNRFWTL